MALPRHQQPFLHCIPGYIPGGDSCTYPEDLLIPCTIGIDRCLVGMRICIADCGPKRMGIGTGDHLRQIAGGNFHHGVAMTGAKDMPVGHAIDSAQSVGQTPRREAHFAVAPAEQKEQEELHSPHYGGSREDRFLVP